jgi:putative dehydrogenase
MDAIGVVGLGKMGFAVAANLVAGGFRVVGFDVEPHQLDLLVAKGGERCGSPAEVAEKAEIVILCLPSVTALHQVLSGEGGLVASGRSGVICVETSTLPVKVKEEARLLLADAGIHMLDCPISGTADMARRKDIVIYASGPAELLDKCRPVFEAVSRGYGRVGDFGDGSKIKLISNLLVCIHTAAAAEALTLAAKCGLDRGVVLELLRAGAGNSRMLEIRGPMMAARQFPGGSSTVDSISKDAEIIVGLADECGCPAPLMGLTSTLLAAARGQHLGSSDPAVIATVLARMAGLEETFE